MKRMGAIGNYFKNAEYRVRKSRHRLEYIGFECTGRCNLACRHCYAECGAEGRDVAREHISRFFGEVARIAGRGKVTVSITGGEPLMRADFFDIASDIKALGFGWNLVSNGTLIDRGIADKLVSLGPATISISIDGLEARHNYVRNSAAAYQATMRGIDNLVSAGFPAQKLLIKTLLFPGNREDLLPLSRLFVGKGIRHWHAFTLMAMGRGKENRQLALRREDGAAVLETLNAIKGRGDIGLKINEDNNLFPTGEKRYCRAGIESFCVLSNGDVVGCVNAPRIPGAAQGNIIRDHAEDVWESRFGAHRNPQWHGCGTHKPEV